MIEPRLNLIACTGERCPLECWRREWAARAYAPIIPMLNPPQDPRQCRYWLPLGAGEED